MQSMPSELDAEHPYCVDGRMIRREFVPRTWRMLSACRGPNLKTVLQRPEGIERIVQSLIFLDGIVTRGEKLPSTRNNRLFGIRDPGRDKFFVALKESSEIKLTPGIQRMVRAAQRTHKNLETHTPEIMLMASLYC
jgi:hypothetical protein